MKATLIDHMGTDLSVVNAARVSYNKKSDFEFDIVDGPQYEQPKLYDRDVSLIRFLARGCTSGEWDSLLEEIFGKGYDSYFDGFALTPVTEEEYEANREEMEELVKFIRSMPTHWTPFGHTSITLHIKAPIFVARQLGKHQVGFVWNEVSRRYVNEDPEFYQPDYWRATAPDKKQGSSNEEVVDLRMQGFGMQTVQDAKLKHDLHSLDLYRDMLGAGVCEEQARMVLPQGMYTEWWWTGNLYSFASMYNTRTRPDTQLETQEIAKQCGQLIEPLFPVSWEALTNGKN